MFAKLFSVLIGILFGLGCTFPDTGVGFFMSASALLGMWHLFSALPANRLLFYLVGVGFHSTSMWWLASTIEEFGGFPKIVSIALLFLYILLSSLQFYFVAILAKILNKYLHKFSSFTLSWMILELTFPRLFPWGLGNFYIYWSEGSAFAEIVGLRGFSLICLILSYKLYSLILESFQQYTWTKNYRASVVKVLFVLSPILMIHFSGAYLIARTQNEIVLASKIRAKVVQGNLSTERKGKDVYLQANLQGYQKLSGDLSEVDILIWPESVFTQWLNLGEGFNDVTQIQLSFKDDPFPDLGTYLLYGGLAFEPGITRKDTKIYNAGLLRTPEGKINGIAAKRILMPFGEYVPFSDYFPWILDILPIHPFTPGRWDAPLQFKTKSGSERIGVVVCYEDLVSDLSRDLAAKGATFLVNLTNDAWYGKSPAPVQHDLLARFRAIETQRYFIRSTNTGYTTLIHPNGEILKSFPIFVEASEVFELHSLSRMTFYAEYGLIPLYLLLGIVLFMGRFGSKNS